MLAAKGVIYERLAKRAADAFAKRNIRAQFVKTKEEALTYCRRRIRSVRKGEGMNNSKIRTHYGEKILECKLPSGWNLLGNLQTKDLPAIGREGFVRA